MDTQITSWLPAGGNQTISGHTNHFMAACRRQPNDLWTHKSLHGCLQEATKRSVDTQITSWLPVGGNQTISGHTNHFMAACRRQPNDLWTHKSLHGCLQEATERSVDTQITSWLPAGGNQTISGHTNHFMAACRRQPNDLWTHKSLHGCLQEASKRSVDTQITSWLPAGGKQTISGHTNHFMAACRRQPNDQWTHKSLHGCLQEATKRSVDTHITSWLPAGGNQTICGHTNHFMAACRRQPNDLWTHKSLHGYLQEATKRSVDTC